MEALVRLERKIGLVRSVDRDITLTVNQKFTARHKRGELQSHWPNTAARGSLPFSPGRVTRPAGGAVLAQQQAKPAAKPIDLSEVRSRYRFRGRSPTPEFLRLESGFFDDVIADEREERERMLREAEVYTASAGADGAIDDDDGGDDFDLDDGSSSVVSKGQSLFSSVGDIDVLYTSGVLNADSSSEGTDGTLSRRSSEVDMDGSILLP